MVSPSSAGDFAHRVIAWQKQSGRHDLPWQQHGRKGDPYRIWLAEIMLQQTQVATVIPYYQRFLARFPDLARLAAAPSEEVMALWSGLGYYARARNLQRAAQLIVAQWGGRFPRGAGDIQTLPGIGRSTAAAIAVFAFGARAESLVPDGFTRDANALSATRTHIPGGRDLVGALDLASSIIVGDEGFPGDKAVENRLWALAETLLPERGIKAYTQGLMDLGATLCTRSRPRCGACPLAAQCVALRENCIAELPSPRARRAVPQRAVTLLVLHCSGRVLLERRPPKGIWGGLLSLPELAAGQPARRYAGATQLPVVRHAFTHFRLDITPLLCKVSRCNTPEGGIWLDLKALDGAPLPAPIRKILASLT